MHTHEHTETYGTFRSQSYNTETFKIAMFNEFKEIKCNTKIQLKSENYIITKWKFQNFKIQKLKLRTTWVGLIAGQSNYIE